MANDVQIIYILTNPSMPGLIKVGITGQADVESRMKQLYTTGVPVPFECNYACKVKNSSDAEKALHFAFPKTFKKFSTKLTELIEEFATANVEDGMTYALNVSLYPHSVD